MTPDQLRASLLRAMFPLVLPRLVGALTAQGCALLLTPLTVACAAIEGYAEAQRAVLRVLP